MKRTQDISDEYLNAFVDNQLESAEKSLVFDAIDQDESLKERVCDLRGLKEMVQHAYHQPPASAHSPVKRMRSWPPYFQALAACLLLLIGGTSGWLGHAWTSTDSEREMMGLFQTTQGGDFGDEPRKIIVQVSTANPTRIASALNETEKLLEKSRRNHRQLQVEIVANGSGADLLRADVTAYADRIDMLKTRYPNLSLMICNQTLGKLRDEGVDVQLLPNTGIAPSAAQQIRKRLLQGWDYVRV
jgi:intracellular sulfur oxidation DsrE/DsrF family protein